MDARSVLSLLCLALVGLASVRADAEDQGGTKHVFSARVEVSETGVRGSRGWPRSHNVMFKPIPGASPELILLDEQDQQIERIDISGMNREELNSLLQKRGFFRRESPTDAVPDEFLRGPYFPHEEL
ncbi:unnamed protein product [Darwinula stevensoni]|uniref:Selenoprotein F/M domain-containing protein n=1 Tax=Darwinula stevensoni TaxID=69355 RepID=A0A7R8X6Q6_9CRUS|nr:unnamed protein product [Darwinula stevensoni]CAG0887863.1 unnamed protein product [Darwinula stevensoni]